MAYLQGLQVAVEQLPFGVMEDQAGHWQQVSKYRLTATQDGSSSPALQATVIPLGAAVLSLMVPDRQGHHRDVVLGFDHLEDYIDQDLYAGVTVGRTSSRVGGSQFELDGKTYKLTRNTPVGHLHGGKRGFSHSLWTPSVDRSHPGQESVTFTYISRDGEEGYPGDVMVSVTYKIAAFQSGNNTGVGLNIEYRGMSGAPTPLSLINHSYFNLAGHQADAAALKEHEISLKSSCRKLVLDGGIAKGDSLLLSPAQTEGKLGDVMQAHGGQIDDVFPLRGTEDRTSIVEAAELYHSGSGIRMSVLTNQPALVAYTANYVNNISGKDGAVYGKHGSIAMETSGYPNAMNVASFPSVLLRPGQQYNYQVSYNFSR